MSKGAKQPRARRAVAKPVEYLWFTGPSVIELHRRLEAALSAVGADHTAFKINLPKDLEQATLEVLNTSGPEAAPMVAGEAPINEAHPCPPLCLEP